MDFLGGSGGRGVGDAWDLCGVGFIWNVLITKLKLM